MLSKNRKHQITRSPGQLQQQGKGEVAKILTQQKERFCFKSQRQILKNKEKKLASCLTLLWKFHVTDGRKDANWRSDRLMPLTNKLLVYILYSSVRVNFTKKLYMARKESALSNTIFAQQQKENILSTDLEVRQHFRSKLVMFTRVDLGINQNVTTRKFFSF